MVTYYANVDAIQEVDVMCSLMNFFMMAVTVDREYMFVDDVNNYVFDDIDGSENLLMV